MAYLAEKENVEYMKYLERHDLGEEEGPRMSKEEWRKMRKQMEGPERTSRILSGTD